MMIQFQVFSTMFFSSIPAPKDAGSHEPGKKRSSTINFFNKELSILVRYKMLGRNSSIYLLWFTNSGKFYA